MRHIFLTLLLTIILSSSVVSAPFSVVDRWETGAGPNAATLANEGKYLLVCNSDTDDVTTINVRTGKIFPAMTVGRVPLAITTSADGKRAFVACFYEKAVAVIDVVEGKVLKKVDLAVHPRDLARVGSKILATGYYEGELLALDEQSGEITSRLKLAQGIHHLAVHPKEEKAYVLNTSRDAIYEVSVNPLKLQAELGAELEYGGAWDFVISPDGSHIIVSQWNGNRVAIVTTNPLAVKGFCPTGGVGPCALDFNDKGTLVAVAQSESNDVAIVDVGNSSLRAVVKVGRFPFSDVKVTDDGRYALVTADRNGTIDVIDMDKLELNSQIEVGRTPHVITRGNDGLFYISNTFGADVVSLVPTGKKGRVFEKLHQEP